MHLPLQIAVLNTNSEIQKLLHTCKSEQNCTIHTITLAEIKNRSAHNNTDIFLLNAQPHPQKIKPFIENFYQTAQQNNIPVVLFCSKDEQASFLPYSDLTMIPPLDTPEIEQQLCTLIRLAKSRKHYQIKYNFTKNIIDNFQNGIWEWNLETHEIQYNAQFYTLAGYEVNEFPQTLDEFKMRVHPDDWERVYKKGLDYIQGKTDHYQSEFRFKRKEGSWMWLLCQGIIMEKDKNKNPVRFIGSHTDISHLKHIQQNLDQMKSFYNTLIDQAPDGVALIQANGKIKYLSPAVYRLLGFTLNNLKVDAFELTHPDDKKDIKDVLQKLDETPEKKQTIQYRIQDVHGEWHWLESTFTNLLNDPGIEAIIVNFRDITEQWNAENALIKSEKKWLYNVLSG